jgi:hypothetical protein
MSELKNNETMPDEEEYVYRMVMDGKTPTRLWSIISLAFSIVAMSVCYFGWPGILFGILGLAILLLDSVTNGIIVLVIAFLVSPIGLPMLAAWTIGQMQRFRYFVQDAIYG